MLAAFASWLIGWGHSLAVMGINFFVDVINASIVAFVLIVTTVAGLLPTGSPLPSMPSIPDDSAFSLMLKALNWFFPVQFIVLSFAFAVMVILAYIVIAPLARWVKLLR